MIRRTNYHELSLIVFANLCCRSMARAVVPLNFNAFLEKAKLKDDGSNYADWVRNLRIILIPLVSCVGNSLKRKGDAVK